MANGMPDWDEWNSLKEDARQYSLFKVLTDIYQKMDCQHKECQARLPKCEKRIDSLEKRIGRKKYLNTAIVSGSGIAGGALAYLGSKIAGILR